MSPEDRPGLRWAATIGPLNTLRTRASAGLLVSLLATGCMGAREMNAVKAEVGRLEQDFGALQVRVEKRINTGGGDVNEPVTGWILAAGYALVPVLLLGYLLAHRFKFFRRIKDGIRGKCVSPDCVKEKT